MSSNYEEVKTKLIQHLLDYSIVRGDFVLKSGKKSSWFCDAKQTACRGDGIKLIADLLLISMPENITAIGGLSAGADPIAFGTAAVSAERGRNLNSFSIRKEPKDHGISGKLAGTLLKTDKAVIVEDTATRGVSALQAVEAVRELGAEPVMAISVVDRGGVCAKLMAEANLEYKALVTALDLGFNYDG